MIKIAMRLAMLAVLVLTVPSFAAEPSEPIKLEDGSYLFIDEDDGSTRMVDSSGKPIKMRNDVEMLTADGETVIMRNNRVWKLVGPPGKKRRSSTIE